MWGPGNRPAVHARSTSGSRPVHDGYRHRPRSAAGSETSWWEGVLGAVSALLGEIRHTSCAARLPRRNSPTVDSVSQGSPVAAAKASLSPLPRAHPASPMAVATPYITW